MITLRVNEPRRENFKDPLCISLVNVYDMRVNCERWSRRFLTYFDFLDSPRTSAPWDQYSIIVAIWRYMYIYTKIK